MFLKQFITINWGNIPNGVFEFGPINLFSGESGSGKTTAADAIQTLFTAAKKGLFQFNPGQDEVTQQSTKKESRTLASYVMGCDENAYSRTQMTDCYIAGVFVPSPSEAGQPFTAVISIRAYLEKENNQKVAKEEKVNWFFVLGSELTLSDFVQTHEASQSTIASNLIIPILSKKYTSEKVFVAQNRKHYLSKFYGLLRGSQIGVSDSESHNAAKAFSAFMAYKPVSDLNTFVKEQVLEKKDLGKAIKNISSSMKSIHMLEQDAKKIKNSISTLSSILLNANEYIASYLKLAFVDKNCAQDKKDKISAMLFQNTKEQTQNRSALSLNQSEIEKNQKELTSLLDQKVLIETKRQGNDLLAQKDKLQKEIDELEAQSLVLAKEVIQTFQLLEDSIKILEHLKAQLSNGLGYKDSVFSHRLVKSMIDSLCELTQIDFKKKEIIGLMNKNKEEFASKCNEVLDKVGTKFIDFVEVIEQYYRDNEQAPTLDIDIYKQKQKISQLSIQKNELEIDIARLSTLKTIRHPNSVQKTLDLITQNVHGANPCVLCDVVEVIDDEWQSAIEGFLGQNRFMIFVDPLVETEVIRYLSTIKNNSQLAKIAQGSRSIESAKSQKLSKQSLVGALKISHYVAESYLKASYGNVLLIEDISELKTASRGITQSGMAANNFTLFNCTLSKEELVFGQGARAMQGDIKKGELAKIEKNLLDGKCLLELLEYLDKLFKNAQSMSPLALQNLNQCWDKVQQCHTMMSMMDTSGHKELESTYNTLNQDFELVQKSLETCQKKSGELEHAYVVLQKEHLKLTIELDKLVDAYDQKYNVYNEAKKYWSIGLEEIENTKISLKQLSKFEEDTQINLTKYRRLISMGCFEHNQNGTQFDILTTDITHFDEPFSVFGAICTLAHEINQILLKLQNNILLKKIHELEDLYKSFEATFITDLSVQIYDAIIQGERRLKNLNKELVKHKFAGETYEFAYEFVPEFKEYYQFFKEIIENPSLSTGQSLFQNEILSQKSQNVARKILSMLLSDDEAKSFFELDRITDYREYRRYEIFKQPEGKDKIALSKYGSGSGGQLETPAYVIRAAQFMSAMKFEEAGAHCRFIIMDESFSKMDEQRSKQVINYLTEVLGLQMIFIMPSSKSGPFKTLLSNEITFTKTKIDKPIGELNTQVFVQSKVYNTDKIIELFEKHKALIAKEAQLDFLAMFEAQGA